MPPLYAPFAPGGAARLSRPARFPEESQVGDRDVAERDSGSRAPTQPIDLCRAAQAQSEPQESHTVHQG